MRILIVVDSLDWAIGHLAQSVIKYNTHHKIKVVEVHPRDAGEAIVQEAFMKEVEKFRPDIINFEYFRTAGQLIEANPGLKKYKTCLMHHNMRDKALYMWNWKDDLHINQVMAHCNKTKRLMEEKGVAEDVKIIRYGFDHSYWTYCSDEPEEKAIGYAGRTVPWKGLKEIAEVAKESNYQLQVMGKVDKPAYWNTVPKDNLRFDYWECSDKERIDFYRNITVFVQNSIDGYEEGTMPLLEAMACGVPVITTPAGQAGDEEGILKDRVNCLVIPFGDKERLKLAVNELMEDEDLRNRLKKKAWETVKSMTEERMAMDYEKIWRDIVYPDTPLASVILPVTYDRTEQLKAILSSMTLQSYPNFEMIIVYDEEEKKSPIDKRQYDFPIKELWTGMNKTKHPYNLAMARNLGIIEARGEHLIFNDSRLKPDTNSVMAFAEGLRNVREVTMGGHTKVWLFGNKGTNKESFVENFSAVRKGDLVKIGMFCERMNIYGGMTQEVRTRWEKNGGEVQYFPQALATEIKSSRTTPEKRKQISKAKMMIYKMYS